MPKIARRDKEIETLKTTHQIEIQKKASEIETLRRQLKKIQEALGGSMAPKPVSNCIIYPPSFICSPYRSMACFPRYCDEECRQK